MEIDFASVSDNYMALPEEEKNIVRKGMSGPMGTIIGKIFGFHKCNSKCISQC